MTLTVKKLKAADYNPRTITDSRLKKLQSSIAEFGDLSGVVYNRRTKTLVSGHQRVKTIKDADTKIVTKPAKDKHGTVALGHIEATTAQGTVRIPFREVDWDITKEKAANIAANAHGGQFDKEKLKMVLVDIEKGSKRKFDLELTGLDSLTIKSLTVKDEDLGNADAGGKQFKEFGADIETEHTCPRCQYAW